MSPSTLTLSGQRHWRGLRNRATALEAQARISGKRGDRNRAARARRTLETFEQSGRDYS